jgi:ATP-binding cassette subfamily B multidrug efflux pump
MKPLRYLNKYFFKYKWHLLLGILFIAITNLFNVYKPEFFGDSIDQLKDWGANGNSENLLGEVVKVGLIYLSLSLASGFFLFLTRQSIIIMSRHVEYNLKNEIYDHYQKLDYSFYKRNSTGDLMNRISEDVTKVRMYLGPGIMYTINLSILFIMAIYNMVQIDGFLTIMVLLPLPIMSFLIYKVSSKINSISGEVQKEQSFMSTLVQESFSGIRVVKAYSRTGEIADNFNKSAENYKVTNMKLVLVNSLFMPTVFVLIGVSTILSIYLGGLMYYTDDITIGEITKFIFYVNMLTWPFASVGWVISVIQRAAASQERINEFLETKPAIVNEVHAPFNFNGTIEFKNVSYSYPNSGIKAIDNLSFKIESGETLGIIGRTGSGKSTILKLICRQVDADEGQILIDGLDIKTINLDAFKKQLGIVPQDVFLFSDSIKSNLNFGTDRELTKEELIQVTKDAHFYHNIEDFKDGFETILGERGVNLSGGQKQRLSIARALIRNPKLLMLDDCLSAVDTETEEVILQRLKEQEVLCSIVVSHRVSSIRNADRIIVLEHGIKVEEGSHQELIEKDDLYASILKRQLLEESNGSQFED